MLDNQVHSIVGPYHPTLCLCHPGACLCLFLDPDTSRDFNGILVDVTLISNCNFLSSMISIMTYFGNDSLLLPPADAARSGTRD